MHLCVILQKGNYNENLSQFRFSLCNQADDWQESSIRYCLKKIYLKFLMQSFNVILHPLNQLSLILSNGSTNVRSDEQSIEAGKDAEHLVGIFSCSQLIPQLGRNSRLHSVYSLIIPTQSKIKPFQFLRIFMNINLINCSNLIACEFKK